jgi:hypothetical protein
MSIMALKPMYTNEHFLAEGKNKAQSFPRQSSSTLGFRTLKMGQTGVFIAMGQTFRFLLLSSFQWERQDGIP